MAPSRSAPATLEKRKIELQVGRVFEQFVIVKTVPQPGGGTTERRDRQLPHRRWVIRPMTPGVIGAKARSRAFMSATGSGMSAIS